MSFQFEASTTLLCCPAQSKDSQMRFLLALVLGVLTQCNSAWAGSSEGFSAFNRKDYATAFTELLPLAEAGDPWAQVTVAQMYALGQGRTKDTERAVYWYRQAADGGSAFAQFQVGLMYQTGDGLPQDDGKAVDWWLRNR
jgi:TPR repeat protein